MAVSIEEIANWLEEEDISFQVKKEKELIFFGARSDSSDTAVRTGHFIRTKEEGKMFSYEVQIRKNDENWAIDPEHPYIETILKFILRENYSSKFGCWEYDYTDGDIKFCVEIPLEDAPMTKEQFSRITSMTMGTLDKMAKQLDVVYETGKIPEEDSESREEMLKKYLLMKALEDGTLDELLGSKKKDSSWDEDGI